MRKNILIPTDFSKNSWYALNYAMNLFKDHTCTFYLLNAYQLYHFTTDSIMQPEPGNKEFQKAKQTSEEGLEKLIDGISIRADNTGNRFEMISTYGTVIDSVKDAIDKYDISLLVMGTKGESNPAHLLYGSTAMEIIEKVHNCPVMVVPEKSLFVEDIKKEIVLATNFKKYFKRKDLIYLVELAKKMDATIRVLYIQKTDSLSAEQENNKEMLEDYLKDVGHTFHTLTNIAVPAGIHSFIESRGSHMLALIDKKHSFFENLFSKSLVQEIGSKPEIPVLVMHTD